MADLSISLLVVISLILVLLHSVELRTFLLLVLRQDDKQLRELVHRELMLL
jgi:hypothetical protein